MESDKKFDQLFQSKLKDIEAGPSVGVWAAIEKELDEPKRKVKIVTLLGIAASLLILLSAGLLFIAPQTKLTGKRLVQYKTIKANPPLNTSKAEKGIENNVTEHKSGKMVTQLMVAVHRLKQKQTAISEIDHGKRLESSVVNLALPATNQQSKQGIINPVVMAKETSVPVEQPVHENIDLKPILAAVSLPAADEPVKEVVKAKHKIKSFGDLVNVVVGKVDKRKDKLIEFTDVDDDESTVTGINLGILKIKKEK